MQYCITALTASLKITVSDELETLERKSASMFEHQARYCKVKLKDANVANHVSEVASSLAEESAYVHWL
jgi:hypothetical protein